jgi:diguanylate cyclase (GGDEF)-like protein
VGGRATLTRRVCCAPFRASTIRARPNSRRSRAPCPPTFTSTPDRRGSPLRRSRPSTANRPLFSERAERAIVEAGRRHERLALVFVDLDDFKAINDRYGHPAGDEVLRLVGERLAAQVRTSDTVARVGGDEFVVLLTNVHDRETAERLAEKLWRVFDRPFALAGAGLALAASLGVSVFPEDGGDPMRLMAADDAAKYRRKGARPLRRMGSGDAVGDLGSGGPEASGAGNARS